MQLKAGDNLRLIAISDIHGCNAQLQRLLEKVKAQPEELLFLGDYVDSGPDSAKVLQRIAALERQGAAALLGNHDALFLDWLKGLEDIRYYCDVGGLNTINSFLSLLDIPPVDAFTICYNSRKEAEIRTLIQREFAAEIQFLATRPLYEKRDQFLFVHAGIDPEKGLLHTSKEQFLNIRESFIHRYQGEEFVVFGHTRTRRLHDTDHIYYGSNRVIGIDGGCAYGGQLNALIIHDECDELYVRRDEKWHTWHEQGADHERIIGRWRMNEVHVPSTSSKSLQVP